jgi:hypothetical protein
MLRSTIHGQLQLDPESLLIQNCWSTREDFRVIRKHLGCILNRQNQHQSSLPGGQWHNRHADPIRRHDQDQTRMLRADHGSRHFSRRIRNNQNRHQNHGLGRQNYWPLPLREQGRNSPSRTRTLQSVQRRIWRYGPPGSIGPTGPARPRQKPRRSLDLYVSSSHDRSRHLPTRSRLLFLEMLLPSNNDHYRDPASAFCSTNANTHSLSPTPGTHAKDPEPRAQKQRYHLRPECQEQRHSH